MRAAAAEGGRIVWGGERRMPRHASISTHDRANEMSDYANTGPASTLALVHLTIWGWSNIIMKTVSGRKG